MKRPAKLLRAFVAGGCAALALGACSHTTATAHSAPTLTIGLPTPNQADTLRVQVGQRILVRLSSRFPRPPESSSPHVVNPGHWKAAPCPPDQCFSLLAEHPGKSRIGSAQPSGCNLPGYPGRCIMGQYAWADVVVNP